MRTVICAALKSLLAEHDSGMESGQIHCYTKPVVTWNLVTAEGKGNTSHRMLVLLPTVRGKEVQGYIQDDKLLGVRTGLFIKRSYSSRLDIPSSHSFAKTQTLMGASN